MCSSRERSLHLVTKKQDKSAKSHHSYASTPAKKMHPSSQNLSFSSILSILVIILAYLTIPTYSIPVQTPTSLSSSNGTSSGDDELGGMSNPPDKMEVMNWILAAISIVIVVELIFWIFKCVNMVRKGSSSNDDNSNNNGFPNRPFDVTSNGPDDECLPPYDGLSLPKYCEAMEMNNNGELRSSHLTEDENPTTPTIVISHEEDSNNNEGGNDERAEEVNKNDSVEINRINNQTSTVVVEMNQVTTMMEGDAE